MNGCLCGPSRLPTPLQSSLQKLFCTRPNLCCCTAQQHSLTNSLPLFIHFLGVVERDVVVAAGVVVCAGAGAGVVSKRYEWAIWNDWRTLHLAPRIGAVVVVRGAGHGRASDRRAADEDFYMRLNKRARPQSFWWTWGSRRDGGRVLSRLSKKKKEREREKRVRE